MTRFLSMLFSIFMFFFSWLIPAEDPSFEPSTFELNSITYKNGFIADNMHFAKDYNFYDAEPIHREFTLTQTNNYYQFENNWIKVNENSSWDVDVKSNIFCPIDDWENLHAYYADPNNYHYYFAVQIDFGEITTYEIPNADTKILDEIIQFAADNKYGTNSSNKAETINIPVGVEDNIRFHKDSNDGLFDAYAGDFLVYEGHVYFYRHSGAGTSAVSILPEEMENYILSLLKTTELNEYFKLSK